MADEAEARAADFSGGSGWRPRSKPGLADLQLSSSLVSPLVVSLRDPPPLLPMSVAVNVETTTVEVDNCVIPGVGVFGGVEMTSKGATVQA